MRQPTSSSLCLALGLLAWWGSLVTGQSLAATTPNNVTQPISFFYTRPESQAPFMNVSIQGNFSPGYVFVAPYQGTRPAPYIYDKFGNLVWDGFGVVGSSNAHNFHVCSYKGSDHLCYNQMNQALGYGIGQALIMDNNYRVVASVQTSGNVPPADMHEFQLINGGETALLSSYQVIPYDLSAYNINSGLGWVTQGVFQEINVTTGEVLFEWFSTNHVDISETQLKPNSTDTSGNGLSAGTAFDYFHINSIDKSSASLQYLVSARHTSTIYLINSTDHTIIWRLSSTGQSDFKCNGFNFSFQHDARFVSETDTTTTISIFDNGSDGYAQSSNQSSGMVIALDLKSKTATLQTQTLFPRQGGILSTSQGNTQLIPNGNTFHGWGNWAYVSEHNSSGDPIFFASLATDKVMNYRAFSMNWTSTPSGTVPQVYSYSQNTTAPSRIYVSWNGATTVAKWKFYGANQIGDYFADIGTIAKAGFETSFVADKYYPWVRVEALANDGSHLRNSSFQPSFVPSQGLSSVCGLEGCKMAA
ncbi:hypothetical protein K461DRAFT_265603 [Myriangium duriaei CBS 260.36]|uniref:ASST-domain-containing protein n=1 Tax=Myriangium duriaei CBS 260.36 TaxID=1168546 RepID=A0A9P4MKC1_9PEZI|nr:hypothetical protein K461DRAFT_265603 [Myriangium duriaei CBS 260.36]